MLVCLPNSWVIFQTQFNSINIFLSFQDQFCAVLTLADTYWCFFIFNLKNYYSITSHRKQENQIPENPLIEYVKCFIFLRLFAVHRGKIIISEHPEE